MKRNIVLNNFNPDKATVKKWGLFCMFSSYMVCISNGHARTDQGEKKQKAFLGLVGMLGHGGCACLSGDQKTDGC